MPGLRAALRPASWLAGIGRPRRSAVVIGALLVAAIAAVFTMDLWVQRQRALERAQWRVELTARLLQERVEIVLRSTSTVMGSLAARLAIRPAASRALEDEPVLADALRRLPWLQALAVLDPHGRVLASTDLALRDRTLALPARPDGADGADAGADHLGQAVVLPVGQQPVVPLWRALSTPEGEWLLVAWIHPAGVLGPTPAQGPLLEPGDVIELRDARGARLAVFDADGPVTALPADEPGAPAIAVHLSLADGLAVQVRRPLDAALRPWRADLRRRLPLMLLALGCVAAMTVVARRGLLGRERTHRQRDAALRAAAEREQELQGLLHSLRELVFRTDADGRLSLTNGRWSVLTGQAGQVAGQPLWALVMPEDRERVRQLFAPGAVGPALREGSFRARGADGGLRHFDVFVVPLDRQGGFAGSAVDVTARVHAEDRLKAQLARSDLVFEASPLPLSLADEAGRLVAVNRAWEQFRGLPRGQVLGQPVRDIVPEEARAAPDARRLPGASRPDTLVFLHDGSRRDVQFLQTVLRRHDGAPEGTLTATVDVSEFRRAERGTRQALLAAPALQAAEAALNARTELLAHLIHVVHEMRVPLQSVLGLSGPGREPAEPDPALRGMLDDIHAAGLHMQALVDMLPAPGALEAGPGTLRREPVHLPAAGLAA